MRSEQQQRGAWFEISLALATTIAAGLLAACGGGGNPPRQTAPTAPSPAATSTSSAVTASTATATTLAKTPVTAVIPQPTRTAPGSPSVTIDAVGDVSLAREVVNRLALAGSGYPYALIRGLLQADLTIANLEGALTERGEAWPKGYNFRTPPRFAEGLRDAGFELVSLANNHTMDYGVIGLTDTIDALDAAGVGRAGAGRYGLEAAAPVYLEANGLRVAFIACAATPREAGGFAIDEWAAAADGAGIFVCQEGALRTWIAEARKTADFVVVVVHAGSEYVHAPNATQRALAAVVLAAGADAYIGHHAHVVQPVEMRGSQLIAWGLGNFIFDLDPVDLANVPEPRVSLILRFTLTKGAGVTSWEAIPVVLDASEDRPRPAAEAEAAVLRGLLVP